VQRARKRFGQHFLHSPSVIDRIVATVSPRAGQRVVEIGPGRGAITEPLLACGIELDAIELDRDLIPDLERLAAASRGRLRIHNADALEFELCALARGGGGVRVVGNLPYNISTPLVFRLLEQRHCIEDMHFMLQKEVVERMAAAPGGAAYGRLSVMVQFHCRVERLFSIGPGAFSPPPKVESAFVRLVPHAHPPTEVDRPDLFELVVRQAFAQRRKTLRNALRPLMADEELAAAGVDPGLRAEQLDIAAFARLADRLARSGAGDQEPKG
jgi:16S rRNA (adenine1518-N6/adenine1519-N6)-dimethyltransferase